MEKPTAVEWFVGQMFLQGYLNDSPMTIVNINHFVRQAKEMEKNIAEEYAEFCIRCDRAGLPIVKFDDWKKELTFKSE
jgi:hypothetical protein